MLRTGSLVGFAMVVVLCGFTPVAASVPCAPPGLVFNDAVIVEGRTERLTTSEELADVVDNDGRRRRAEVERKTATILILKALRGEIVGSHLVYSWVEPYSGCDEPAPAVGETAIYLIRPDAFDAAKRQVQVIENETYRSFVASNTPLVSPDGLVRHTADVENPNLDD